MIKVMVIAILIIILISIILSIYTLYLKNKYVPPGPTPSPPSPPGPTPPGPTPSPGPHGSIPECTGTPNYGPFTSSKQNLSLIRNYPQPKSNFNIFYNQVQNYNNQVFMEYQGSELVNLKPSKPSCNFSYSKCPYTKNAKINPGTYIGPYGDYIFNNIPILSSDSKSFTLSCNSNFCQNFHGSGCRTRAEFEIDPFKKQSLLTYKYEATLNCKRLDICKFPEDYNRYYSTVIYQLKKSSNSYFELNDENGGGGIYLEIYYHPLDTDPDGIRLDIKYTQLKTRDELYSKDILGINKIFDFVVEPTHDEKLKITISNGTNSKSIISKSNINDIIVNNSNVKFKVGNYFQINGKDKCSETKNGKKYASNKICQVTYYKQTLTEN